MARVVKPPTGNPPFGKTPLQHGAKVEIVSLCSGKTVLMDANGAIRANISNHDLNSGRNFIVSQLGSAVMLQCALTRHVIGANAGYLYGFRATEQQGALRVYYHEDSGAIEFEACADPGKFLACDRFGNIIPLNGTSTPIQRQFAVRIVEKEAKQEAAKGSISGLLSMGKKAVTKVVGEGNTQFNFEKNQLRNVMLNQARIRLRSKTTGRYLAIMSNGIVHGNGDQSDLLIVHHCFGLLRYAFQSAKFPQLWLCVTLDNITWAMVNSSFVRNNKENPAMVWEVDKCKSDGTVLLRRNTQISNGIIHQYLGFAPNGKPTPTLIYPEDLGDMVIERQQSASFHALNNPAVPHPGSAPPPRQQGPPPPTNSSAPPPAAMGGVPLNYGSAPPPPPDFAPPPGSAPPPIETSQGGLYSLPPGALLYDGSVVVMKNKIGYLCVEGGKVSTSSSVTKDCDWKVSSSGFMMFSFENVKNGGFMKASDSSIKIGPAGQEAVFQVRFNPNGSVSFQSSNGTVFIGIKDPEIFLEMV